MSLFSLVFYIFISINEIFYYGMMNFVAFLALIRRISCIFDLEEYHSDRKLPISAPGKDADAYIELKKCCYSWGF